MIYCIRGFVIMFFFFKEFIWVFGFGFLYVGGLKDLGIY